MEAPAPAGYRLEIVDKPDEIESVAMLSTAVHDAGVGEMTRQLAFNHPDSSSMRWLAVRESQSGEVVSSIALLPWTIMYDGIEIPAGEMGIVGTRKDSRRLGLVSALAGEFDTLLRSEGYLLSPIQGIPWFYRKYGYEYTIPLETKVVLEPRQIPGTAAGEVTLRGAVTKDIDSLASYYRESIEQLDIAAARSNDQWTFLLGPSMKTDYAADTYMVETRGSAVGYCRVFRQGFGEGLLLGECSNLPQECFPGLFSRLKEFAKKRGKPYIRVNLGPTHPAVIAAKELGASDGGGYAWQIRIPDPAAFLKAIEPSLQARLQASPFAAQSGVLELDLYREKVLFRFRDGRITEIGSKAADKKEKGVLTLRMPPNLLPPLLLGQKSYADCASFYPDLSGSLRAQRLFNALFPPMNGFLHCPY